MRALCSSNSSRLTWKTSSSLQKSTFAYGHGFHSSLERHLNNGRGRVETRCRRGSLERVTNWLEILKQTRARGMIFDVACAAQAQGSHQCSKSFIHTWYFCLHGQSSLIDVIFTVPRSEGLNMNQTFRLKPNKDKENVVHPSLQTHP